MANFSETFDGDYGPRRLSVELANICNLHCSYCFRSDENLYSSHAEFFPLTLLERVIGTSGLLRETALVAVSGGLSVGVFLLMAALLRLEELRWLTRLLRQRLGR